LDETILTLKSGVMLTESDGKIGFTLDGQTHFANNATQSALLLALAAKPHTLEVLLNLLHKHGDSSYSEIDISLAMAEFILDFGEYLES